MFSEYYNSQCLISTRQISFLYAKINPSFYLSHLKYFQNVILLRSYYIYNLNYFIVIRINIQQILLRQSYYDDI